MQILVHGAGVVGGAWGLLENERFAVHGDAEEFMMWSIIVMTGSVMLMMTVGRWALR